jgi:putative endonuclease
VIARRHAGGMERASTTEAQRIGDAGERLVARRLQGLGWTILARNLRVGRDEIDLLAVDPHGEGSLVVVEVRRRGRRDFGLAEESLDRRKRTALRRAVGTLLERGSLPDGRPLPRLPLRVDLVALDVDPGGRQSLRHHRAIAP